jgi:methyltransferase
MVVSRESYLMLLAALVAERAFELWLSRRNARRALARGGLEVGRAQYRIMVAFHTLFIAACVAGAMTHNGPVSPALSVTALIGETAAQGKVAGTAGFFTHLREANREFVPVCWRGVDSNPRSRS